MMMVAPSVIPNSFVVAFWLSGLPFQTKFTFFSHLNQCILARSQAIFMMVRIGDFFIILSSITLLVLESLTVTLTNPVSSASMFLKAFIFGRAVGTGTNSLTLCTFFREELGTLVMLYEAKDVGFTRTSYVSCRSCRSCRMDLSDSQGP
eukprot:UN4255